MHLLGVARLGILSRLTALGVASVDSASALRSAWMSATNNYLTAQNGWYMAIRIPMTRTRQIQDGFREHPDEACRLTQLERACLDGVRAYAASRGEPAESLVADLIAYVQGVQRFVDRLHEETTGRKRPNRKLTPAAERGVQLRLERTLSDRPWAHCSCPLCRAHGVEMLIFRGNNRNRRRGFHNTYVFYNLVDHALQGRIPDWRGQVSRSNDSDSLQLMLPIPN
jgi:hypothetical protein